MYVNVTSVIVTSITIIYGKNMFYFSLGYIRKMFQFYVLKLFSHDQVTVECKKGSGYAWIPSWTSFGYGQISIETETYSLAMKKNCIMILPFHIRFL